MAAEKIDMSLDDIIKQEGIHGARKGPARRSGGPGGNTGGNAGGNTGGGGGGNRISNNNSGAMRNQRNSNRAAPYSRAPRIQDKWQHDMFDGPSHGGPSGSNHLLVSNLDYGVSNKDIQELFAEFGGLKKAAVHYDRSGRSLGTADVIFEKRGDASAAMKQYNGVLLDGRPMKITILPSGDNQRRTAPQQSGAGAGGNFRSKNFGNNASRGGPRQNQQNRNTNRGASGNSYNNNNNNNNRGPNRRMNQNRKPVTAEELDADLDAYVNK